jgi:hypothetical protein
VSADQAVMDPFEIPEAEFWKKLAAAALSKIS